MVTFFRGLVDAPRAASLGAAVREAVFDLAHQVVAQARAPAVKSLSQDERSPYRGLCGAATALDAAPPGDAAAFQALRRRVEQSLLFLRAHRAELAGRGADLNTTFQLTRIRQQLDRLVALADLRHTRADAVVGAMVTSLVRDVLRSVSGRRLFARSADLVVQNIVDGAAHVGRAYLEGEKSSWGAAFCAGAAGGALMLLATLVKFFLSGLHLPTFYEGLAFSANYASVFCAAYLLHATIATKLPAHTAAALARSAQSGGPGGGAGASGHRQRLAAFDSVWRSTLRLQFAGLLGNVVVAGPLAFLVDVAVHRASGHHVLAAAKAEHILAANSVLGPSFLYAALTGAFLWISSVVGAWSDNWARVHRLGDRLATNRHVMTRVSGARARLWADALVSRFGGLVGNASLGFLLGGVPAACAIGRLPVEIRHVTVSTSSVGLALASGAGTGTAATLALCGLVVIATVNVAVSFLLALWLSLRATRGLRASVSAHAIIRIGLGGWAARMFRRRPAPRAGRGVVAPAMAARTW
ncbi:MAG: hypothetical protein JOZ69_14990 [Myxococcales bacterium]|nr:hypothetical protein [Myxococcales bacterium]